MITIPHPFSRFMPPSPELMLEEVFDLLSNKRRRGVFHYLKETDSDQVTVDELVEAVVAWESSPTPNEITESQRASVYSSLVQTHLPRMVEASVIEYDSDEGTIASTDRTHEVELYLEHSPRRDIPWAEFYVGFSAVAAALVAVVWVGIPPFDGLTGLTVASLIVLILVVSSVIHLYQTRRSRLGSEAFEAHIERD